MSDKWWDGLTPEGVQSTLNRAIQIKDERIAELEHKLKQERKAYEKDIYVWQDNYASLEAMLQVQLSNYEALAEHKGETK